MEINGGAQGRRTVEESGLGRQEIRMETEFGTYKGDGFDRSYDAGEEWDATYLPNGTVEAD